MSVGDHDKSWMDELKDGKTDPNLSGKAINALLSDKNNFSGSFKFAIGEKVYSRIHECKGIVEYSEMTRYITGDQISYKIRFNDPEDVKTEISSIDEQWLDRI